MKKFAIVFEIGNQLYAAFNPKYLFLPIACNLFPLGRGGFYFSKDTRKEGERGVKGRATKLTEELANLNLTSLGIERLVMMIILK